MKPGRPCNAVLGEPDGVIVKMLVDGTYDPNMANPDERRAAVDIMLNRGYEYRLIASRLDCCDRTVQRYVQQLGRTGERPSSKQFDHDQIIADYAAGLPIQRIATKHGCSVRTINTTTYGMPRRRPFGNRVRPTL